MNDRFLKYNLPQKLVEYMIEGMIVKIMLNEEDKSNKYINTPFNDIPLDAVVMSPELFKQIYETRALKDELTVSDERDLNASIVNGDGTLFMPITGSDIVRARKKILMTEKRVTMDSDKSKHPQLKRGECFLKNCKSSDASRLVKKYSHRNARAVHPAYYERGGEQVIYEGFMAILCTEKKPIKPKANNVKMQEFVLVYPFDDEKEVYRVKAISLTEAKNKLTSYFKKEYGIGQEGLDPDVYNKIQVIENVIE